MIDPSHVESLLKYLHIQQKLWRGLIERAVLASVRAFHFLHKVRFGGRLGAGRPDLSPEHSDSTDDDDVVDDGRTRKSQRAGATLDCTDSDSTATGNSEVTQPPSKARRTLPIQPPISEATGVVPTAPNTSAVAARRPPLYHTRPLRLLDAVHRSHWAGNGLSVRAERRLNPWPL